MSSADGNSHIWIKYVNLLLCYVQYVYVRVYIHITGCEFDRASSLIRGNKKTN